MSRIEAKIETKIEAISQYNEVGTMLASTDNIYFFNGKRFTFYCKIPPSVDNDIMFVNGKIYCWSSLPAIWHLKNDKFVPIPSTTNLCTKELSMWDICYTNAKTQKQPNLHYRKFWDFIF